ncbi:FecR family protein [Cyclobacterium xiamenense]|uniref:FecR family protein n=1 Tax=Cyclobacterium xiamenense TaxID=1297121 RepID=UPI0012B924C3|nr:FecR family protein [Cyclobacterium xiamenense]
MKTSKNIDTLIIRKLSGTATEEELHTLGDWLNSSEVNRQYAEQTQKIWEKSMDSKIYRAIDLDKNWKTFKTQSKWGEGRSVHNTWWKVAAVLVFALSFAWLGYDFWIGQQTVTIAAQEQAESHYLPDGSLVYLQPDSWISYRPESFQSSDRNVSFAGKAYFQIQKKNAAEHFIVNTFNSQTIVLGTAFTLNTDKKATSTRLRLYEGKVLFTTTRDSVTLQPGEEVILTGSKLEKKNLRENPKSLNFQNSPLEEVFSVLSETYLVEFFYDGAWPGCEISGNLDAGTLEETMQHLDFILGINYSINAKLVIIEKIDCNE